jgi:hypothetical protein
MSDDVEPAALLIAGELYTRITCIEEQCADCGVARGQLHQTGCDQERCPRCSKQIYTCGCPFDDA